MPSCITASLRMCQPEFRPENRRLKQNKKRTAKRAILPVRQSGSRLVTRITRSAHAFYRSAWVSELDWKGRIFTFTSLKYS